MFSTVFKIRSENYGVAYLLLNGEAFPNSSWVDFVCDVAWDWASVARELGRDSPQTMSFFDGTQFVEVSLIEEGLVKLKCFEKRRVPCDSIPVIRVKLDSFRREILAGCEDLLLQAKDMSLPLRTDFLDELNTLRQLVDKSA